MSEQLMNAVKRRAGSGERRGEQSRGTDQSGREQSRAELTGAERRHNHAEATRVQSRAEQRRTYHSMAAE